MAQQATGNSALGSALVSSVTAGTKQLLYDQAAQLLRDKGMPKAERLMEAVSLMASGRVDGATALLTSYISEEFADPSRRQTLLIVMEQVELWSTPLLGQGNEVSQVAGAARRIIAQAPALVASTILVPPAAANEPTFGAPSVSPATLSRGGTGLVGGATQVSGAESFTSHGQALFDRGHYAAALEAFVLAAVSDPGPLRVFDLAKTYEALESSDAAAFLYRRFLNQTELSAQREAAQTRLAQLVRRRRAAPTPVVSTSLTLGVPTAPSAPAVSSTPAAFRAEPAPVNPVTPTSVSLGTIESIGAAQGTMANWVGRNVRCVDAGGSLVQGALVGVSSIQVIVRSGSASEPHDLLGLAACELVK